MSLTSNQISMNKESINIRKAIPTDLEAIYTFICTLENEELDKEAFARVFESNLLHNDILYLVAEWEQQPAGFISFHAQQLLHHCDFVGEIQEFFIAPEYRNKGIGRLLVEEIKAYAAANNIRYVEVTTNKRRTENVQIYEALGFRLTHHKFTLPQPE